MTSGLSYRCDVCRAARARCDACRERHNAAQRAWRAARRTAGQCMFCIEPAEPGMEHVCASPGIQRGGVAVRKGNHPPPPNQPRQTKVMRKNAIIYEQGNGLPSAGEHCSDGERLYRVDSIDSRIQTDSLKGNYVHATVTPVKWEACNESEEHSALVRVTD